METAPLRIEVTTDYTKWKDLGKRELGRVYSHSYRVMWEKVSLYCPNCGLQMVWHAFEAGDYYAGEEHLCVACHHGFTIQGPSLANDEQDRQRLAQLKGKEV